MNLDFMITTFDVTTVYDVLMHLALQRLVRCVSREVVATMN